MGRWYAGHASRLGFVSTTTILETARDDEHGIAFGAHPKAPVAQILFQAKSRLDHRRGATCQRLDEPSRDE